MQIDLDGRMYEVRAKVMSLEGYSAHADQAALVDFARGQGSAAREVVLVHGEERAKRALAGALQRAYDAVNEPLTVSIP